METSKKSMLSYVEHAWQLIQEQKKLVIVLVAGATICTFAGQLVFPDLVANILDLCILTLLSLGIIHVTKEALAKRTPLAEDVVKVASTHWVKAILSSLVTGICLMVLFLLLIIPGVIMSVFWAFLLQIIFFEGKSFFDALGRSKQLVSGKWWDVFFLGLILFGIGLVMMFVVLILQGVLQIILSPRVAYLLTELAMNMLGALGTMSLTLLYLDYTKTTPVTATPVQEPAQ